MQSSSQSKFVGKVRPILKHNDPHLRHVCPPFDWDNPAHMQGLADLLETLIDSQRARGLAAPQIGLLARAFAMKIEKTIYAVVNPKIINSSAISTVEEEECMSFPNLRVKVQRPTSGQVQFHTDRDEDIIMHLVGWDFRCFLHEMDHLQGITIDLIRRKQKA